MTDTRAQLIPGPDHPISVEPAGRAVTGCSGHTDLAGSVWCHPRPDQPVADIAGRVAFYADRFDFAME
jgi:hypothetical protein